jgi:hypothetical protein
VADESESAGVLADRGVPSVSFEGVTISV